jgi:hypothetical protein
MLSLFLHLIKSRLSSTLAQWKSWVSWITTSTRSTSLTILLSILFFDNKLIQASLCTATFLTSQATTFSKLLEQYKKQAAAAG